MTEQTNTMIVRWAQIQMNLTVQYKLLTIQMTTLTNTMTVPTNTATIWTIETIASTIKDQSTCTNYLLMGKSFFKNLKPSAYIFGML